MPSSLAQQYFPILIQIVLASAVGSAMVAASLLLGKKIKDPVKDSPYECGMKPIGSAQERFSVKFYLVAMVFILFDVEVIFLYPWATVYSDLGFYGFIIMFFFVGLVLLGFFYIWKKGVLDWAAEPRPERTHPQD